MLRLPRGNARAEEPRHDPNYEKRLDAWLTPPKDFRKGVRAGRDILSLVEGEVQASEPGHYSSPGALAAARSVVLGGSFRPGADLLPETELAEARQKTIDGLEADLLERLANRQIESPATLHLAAAYVALTGRECWEEVDAAYLRGTAAVGIRERLAADTEQSLRSVAALAPDFRLVVGEEPWRNRREKTRVSNSLLEELRDRVDAALHVPFGLKPPASTHYTTAAASLRLIQAESIERIPDNPDRGIDIIDPPFVT